MVRFWASIQYIETYNTAVFTGIRHISTRSSALIASRFADCKMHVLRWNLTVVSSVARRCRVCVTVAVSRGHSRSVVVSRGQLWRPDRRRHAFVQHVYTRISSKVPTRPPIMWRNGSADIGFGSWRDGIETGFAYPTTNYDSLPWFDRIRSLSVLQNWMSRIVLLIH